MVEGSKIKTWQPRGPENEASHPRGTKHGSQEEHNMVVKRTKK